MFGSDKLPLAKGGGSIKPIADNNFVSGGGKIQNEWQKLSDNNFVLVRGRTTRSHCSGKPEAVR